MHEAPTLRATSRPSKPSVVDPLVLVVDDQPDARDMYCTTLEHLGYRAIASSNAIEAIDAAREHQPDVVLMDIGMPGVDGIEATRRLKSDATTKGAFVVLMTASGGIHFDEGVRAGCNSFLCKPFNPFVLDEILGAYRRDADPGIVKRCACGASYNRVQWKALPLCGTMLHRELRNCACGSSLALSRRDLEAVVP
jgi:two-component system cell cycle response regulator DivK